MKYIMEGVLNSAVSNATKAVMEEIPNMPKEYARKYAQEIHHGLFNQLSESPDVVHDKFYRKFSIYLPMIAAQFAERFGCTDDMQLPPEAKKYIGQIQKKFKVAMWDYGLNTNNPQYISLQEIEDEEVEDDEDSRFVQHKYEIIPLYSFADANKYKDIGPWCICTTRSHYNGYSDNGRAKGYLLLRNDYETVEEIPESFYPDDEYGRSAIMMFVDQNGDIAHMENRWNRKPNIYGKDAIEKLTGMPFDTTFTPFTEYEKSNIEVMWSSTNFKSSVEEGLLELVSSEDIEIYGKNWLNEILPSHVKYEAVTSNGDLDVGIIVKIEENCQDISTYVHIDLCETYADVHEWFPASEVFVPDDNLSVLVLGPNIYDISSPDAECVIEADAVCCFEQDSSNPLLKVINDDGKWINIIDISTMERINAGFWLDSFDSEIASIDADKDILTMVDGRILRYDGEPLYPDYDGFCGIDGYEYDTNRMFKQYAVVQCTETGLENIARTDGSLVLQHDVPPDTINLKEDYAIIQGHPAARIELPEY